jgi:hypothetical protein
MLISFNPDAKHIAEICELSKQKSAKWIKNLDTGDMVYFPSDSAFHAEIANALHIKNYSKGIAIDD